MLKMRERGIIRDSTSTGTNRRNLSRGGITQLGNMKKNKPCGPDCLTIEVAKTLEDEGDEAAIWMTGVLNDAMNEGIPEEWRTGTTPIYKQKGDPLECNNFRGIKL